MCMGIGICFVFVFRLRSMREYGKGGLPIRPVFLFEFLSKLIYGARDDRVGDIWDREWSSLHTCLLFSVLIW